MNYRAIRSIQSADIGTSLTVCGWVRTLRQQKSVSFLEINDGSSLAGLQILLEESLPQYALVISALSTGSSLVAQGTLVACPERKQAWELKATSVQLLGDASKEDYPLQKKRHSFEFLRTIAHLRPRTNTQGAVARVRNTLAFATHHFFQERGFLWVPTPILTGADCEGAGQQFTVTTLDLNRPPRHSDGTIDFHHDFFARQAYLTVSGQLNAEAYACALSKVYTFGPTFRAENSHTSRHLSEFWMVEPEMAFADLQDDMECAEAYLKGVFRAVLEQCPQEMEFFDAFIDKGAIQRLHHIVDTPFAHLTYSEAIDQLVASGKSFAFPPKWGNDLQSEHERYLAEEYCQKPVILTDYPRQIKSFYMRDNGDGKTVAAMDILVAKVGEIVGGSQREERLDRLRAKMVEFGLNPADYYWYLQLRQYGTVPHAGFGAGFERLLLFITGLDNIRDVVPFPRTPGSIDC